MDKKCKTGIKYNSSTAIQRRTLLAATAGLAGLAGCSGGDGTRTTGSSPTQTPTSSSTPTPEPTPDQDSLSAADCEGETVTEDITSDTTWSPGDCPRVFLQGPVFVRDGATLTIEPGVEVVGTSRLHARNTGTIVAEGELSDPVWFHGQSSEPGSWQGIKLDEGASATLENVVIQYGGHRGPANIRVRDDSELSIVNTVSVGASGAGLYADHEATLTTFSNNAFTDNEGPPVDLHPNHLGSLEGTSSFENNGDSFVAVHWDSTDRGVPEDGTWPKMSLPYRFAFSNDDWVVLKSRIEIEAGTRFEFGQAKGLRVGTGGTLVAAGEPDDKIEFVGETDETGFWNGIRVLSPSQDNELRHVRISNGGATTFQKADLVIANSEENPAQATVRNCELTHSSDAGVVVPHTGALVGFGDNRLADNEGPPIRAHPRRLPSLDATSTFENNGDSFVGVQWDSTDRQIREDGTWPKMPIPYRFAFSNDDWVVLQSRIEIESGARFEFGQAKGLRVGTDGTLVAVGESDDRVEFVGATDETGFWNGLRVFSPSQDNELRYVRISNGGATTFQKADLVIANSEENPARATVRNCELTHSSYAGAFVSHKGELVDFGDNRMADNDGPPLRMHPRRLASLEASSTFENNGDSFVGVQWDSTDRNVRDGGTWKELPIPYRFEFANDDWVDLRDRIEVEPGAAFEFGQAQGLRVKEGGTLVADGTEQNPIVFEGAQSQQGYWNGIRVSDGVGSRFSYLEISDGGATTFSRANIGAFGDGTATSVSESSVTNSAGYGLWEGEDASLGVGGNTFSGNSEGAIKRVDEEN